MKIPKKLQIIGREVDIVFDKKLYEEHKCIGRVDPDCNRIILMPIGNYGKISVTKVSLEIAFLHEVIHFIGEIIEVDPKETIVMYMSEVWHQIIQQIET